MGGGYGAKENRSDTQTHHRNTTTRIGREEVLISRVSWGGLVARDEVRERVPPCGIGVWEEVKM